MQTASETDIRIGWNQPESAMRPRSDRSKMAKRKLVNGVFCPRCRADAIYRYGKTGTGKKRYLCQVCRRQFSLKRSDRLGALERPACPTCGKPMHVYMRHGGMLRFRCSDYPSCRTFLKIAGEAHLTHAHLLPVGTRPG
jgi:ssDNA-binding Zn-finger/Zn-ribbon topoisomerase 1